MANHKSAIKRNIQSQKRRLRNRMVKTRVKTAVKKVLHAQASSDIFAASAEFKTAQSVIDKAAQKGVLHRRTAARKISRLAKRANSRITS